MSAKDLYKPISYVDTDGARPRLMVAGKPFFYNAIQFSLNRLMDRDGWTWDELEQLFTTASADGFTVIGVPILWNHIEPSEGTFSWMDVNKSLDYCEKYGLKAEFLWFGSQICSTSKLSEGTPQYVLDKYEKVCGLDGNALYYEGVDQISGKLSRFFKLDIADARLLERESYVLNTLMEHIKEYLSAKTFGNVLIGIELLNEPTAYKIWGTDIPPSRSFSAYAQNQWKNGSFTDTIDFNACLLIKYLNGLGKAVKQSGYAVWTRVNFYEDLEGAEQLSRLISINEANRKKSESYVDFVGKDLYSRIPEDIYQYCTDSNCHTGKNLVMVMENGGHYENTDRLMINALAGNGYYHIWEICDTMESWPAGVYSVSGKELKPKPHRKKVADMNHLLLKNRNALAKNCSGSNTLKFLNRHFSGTVDISERINGWKVTYRCWQEGMLIVSLDNNSLTFLASEACRITVGQVGSVASLECGLFDSHGQWIKSYNIKFKINQEGEVKFSVQSYCCVRIVFDS